VRLAKLTNDDGLAAILLADLARQCYDLGHSRDGLEIVQLAQYGSRNTATALLRAMLATREAWAYAQLGESRAFNRTAGLAEKYFSEGPSDGDHRFIRYFDAAELAGTIGGRYRDLARHEPQWTRKAQHYTQQALVLRHPSKLRLRAFDLVGLARTQLIATEPQHACELVHQAMPISVPWMNGRVGARLRDFHREASQYADIPAVRDTRDLIQELTPPTDRMKGIGIVANRDNRAHGPRSRHHPPRCGGTSWCSTELQRGVGTGRNHLPGTRFRQNLRQGCFRVRRRHRSSSPRC
jgi:hypothetical protein